MGLGHDQAPAIGADALDETGNIARFVLTVLKRAVLIPEHQCAEEDLAQGIVRKNDTGIALRTTELVQPLDLMRRPELAGETRIGNIVEISLGLRPELDHAAAIDAVGNSAVSERRVRIEQGALMVDFAAVARLARRGERRGEGRAPVAQSITVALRCDLLPAGRPFSEHSGRLPNDAASGAGEGEK